MTQTTTGLINTVKVAFNMKATAEQLSEGVMNDELREAVAEFLKTNEFISKRLPVEQANDVSKNIVRIIWEAIES